MPALELFKARWSPIIAWSGLDARPPIIMRKNERPTKGYAGNRCCSLDGRVSINNHEHTQRPPEPFVSRADRSIYPRTDIPFAFPFDTIFAFVFRFPVKNTAFHELGALFLYVLDRFLVALPGFHEFRVLEKIAEREGRRWIKNRRSTI